MYRGVFTIATLLIAIACFVAVMLTFRPGGLDPTGVIFLVMLTAIFTIPCALVLCFLVFHLWWKDRHRDIGFAAIQFLLSAIVVMSSYILVHHSTMTRLIFELERPQLEALIQQGITLDPEKSGPRRVGVYEVDAIAIDPRGGVYFRTGTGSDGIGPDIMSHGFVHEPNQKGTPFGAARLRLTDMGNGWFMFQSSDDYD